MIFKITFKHLLKNPLSSLLTILAMTAALSLLGSFWTLVENLERVRMPRAAVATSSEAGVLPGLTVFISPKLTGPEVEALKNDILTDKRFKAVEVVSSEEAMNALENQFGETLSKVFQDEKLPISLKLEFTQGTMTRDELLTLLNALRAKPGVLDVDDGLAPLPTQGGPLTSRLFSWATLFLAVVFVVVALLVSHMIRMAFEPLRAELETLQILGAAKSWIFVPLLVEGVLLGLFGVFFSIVFITVAVQVVLPNYSALLLPKGLTVTTLSLKSTLSLVGLGLLASLVGAFLTYPLVNKSSVDLR